LSIVADCLNNIYVSTIGMMVQHASLPSPYIVEGLFIGQVKHKYEGCSSAVVCCSESAESLLSCCVPYLQNNLSVFPGEKGAKSGEY